MSVSESSDSKSSSPSKTASPTVPEEVRIVQLPLWREMLKFEDWWAIWLGFLILAIATASVWPRGASTSSNGSTSDTKVIAKSDASTSEAKKPDAEKSEGEKPLAEKSPNEKSESAKTEATSKPASDRKSDSATKKKPKLSSPIKPWIGKLAAWEANPLESFGSSSKGYSFGALAALGAGLLVLFGGASAVQGIPIGKFAMAFVPMFALTIVAFLLSEQKVVKYYNLETVLWGLVVGMVVSNTLGVPLWLKPAIRTEFFIKTGLVLLGAEVLFGELVALGVPGICVSWLVTPVVLIGTYMFGQRVLKMESRSLNLVISADMSVCGVSAAIATGAACRAKKEELSLAIGLSLAFTVVMMIVQPAIIKAVGMDPAVGGAWLGGTIDSTGAVVAAGEMLAEPAKTVAATVKMIQNILIGVVAFVVAIYWVTYVDRNEKQVKPDLREIWYRFPKFILGFIAASALFSFLNGMAPDGSSITSAAIDVTKSIRGWLFAMAFVSIGLESNFKQLGSHFKGGKPLVLYVCGQALNLALSLFMAWLMFGVLYKDVVKQLGK